ncbi:hypothetical protein GCM10029992_45490 [Glycomyces albus]
MLDNDPPEPTWSARPAHTAYAAVAGVALGLVDVLWGFFSPLTVAAVIAVSGALAAIVKLSLPLITVGVGSLLVTSAVVGQFSGSDSIVGFLIGIVYAFCFLVAALVVALVRARRSYLRRGWDLAFAEAREHEARLEQAVTREREAMAGRSTTGWDTG